MPTLAPPSTLDQQSIRKKIQELVEQLPLGEKIQVEAQITRTISEELAATKESSSSKQWTEYLHEQGVTKKDAAKRARLLTVPQLIWSVGTVMVAQLAVPMYQDIYSRLLEQPTITQELVDSEMSKVRQERKLEREELKVQRAETESKFFEWTTNQYGTNTLIAQIHEDAGRKLEYMLSTFRKASENEADFNLFINELLEVYESSDRWIEVEALSELHEFNNITPETIPLSQVGPGMRIEIIDPNSPRFGQQARIISFNNGSGWQVIFDSESHQDWAATTEVKVVDINTNRINLNEYKT